MESIIKWQTGEPKEKGFYLVTLESGEVIIEHLTRGTNDELLWFGNLAVKAWCKLTDIKPYKEETK